MCIQTNVHYQACGHTIPTHIEPCGEAWRRPDKAVCPDVAEEIECIKSFPHECWNCDPAHAEEDKEFVAERQRAKTAELEQRARIREQMLQRMDPHQQQAQREALKQVGVGQHAHILPSVDEEDEDLDDEEDEEEDEDGERHESTPLPSAPRPSLEDEHTVSTAPSVVVRQPAQYPGGTLVPSEGIFADSDIARAQAASQAELSRKSQHDADLEAAIRASAEAHLAHQRTQLTALPDDQLHTILERSLQEHSTSSDAAFEDELARAIAASEAHHAQTQAHTGLAGDDDIFAQKLRESEEMHRQSQLHSGLIADENTMARLLRESALEYQQSSKNEEFEELDAVLAESRRAAEQAQMRQWGMQKNATATDNAKSPPRMPLPTASPSAEAVRSARISALSQGRPPSATLDALPPAYSTSGSPPLSPGSGSMQARSSEEWWRDEAGEAAAKRAGKGKGRQTE